MSAACRVTGCDRRLYAVRMCKPHYEWWRRHDAIIPTHKVNEIRHYTIELRGPSELDEVQAIIESGAQRWARQVLAARIFCECVKGRIWH